ncbi:MAG: allophanate hydrolase [Rubrivivax sp.]|nr:MAG: allophanate hydrolase [Rubrivivax sp.]
MTERSLLTVGDWHQAYQEGGSPRELLGRAAAALGRHDAAVWIHKASAETLDQQVAALEVQLALAGTDRTELLKRFPLFGVPFAAKDNIDVAGMPTTAACRAFAYEPAVHANAVRRLIEAGAVCLGKTNLDQFATGLVGARSPYGRPASAFDATRVSGGSSSGSAVAVARAEVAFSLGTDTAGSGRVPAGFNNLVGLKPTPGRVGTSGVVPACRTLDCVSVFALTVEDAAAVLAVIEGPDPQDAYSQFEPGPTALPARLRIGVPSAPQVDAEFAPAWSRALDLAEELGHKIVPLDFAPLHAVAGLLYDGPWVAERHAVVQSLLETYPEAMDPTVRRVIEGALQRTATETFKAQYTLRAAQRDTAALWQQVDVLMVPTAPGHPSFNDVDADPMGANARLGRYTNFVNLLRWCALALPAGFNEQGLPFGVTFIAPGQADAALARFGQRWQVNAALPLGATGARRPLHSAAAWPAAEPTLPLAVVGAHLSGMPLNSQLTERGATLREATTTAPSYRLHALRGTVPPKPGLQRVAEGGGTIAVEVWNVPLRHVGSLLALIPSPLGLGRVELADRSTVHGFICEGHGLAGATDITSHGGWRAFMASQRRA